MSAGKTVTGATITLTYSKDAVAGWQERAMSYEKRYENLKNGMRQLLGIKPE